LNIHSGPGDTTHLRAQFLRDCQTGCVINARLILKPEDSRSIELDNLLSFNQLL
jgi:hypothetical protein